MNQEHELRFQSDSKFFFNYFFMQHSNYSLILQLFGDSNFYGSEMARKTLNVFQQYCCQLFEDTFERNFARFQFILFYITNIFSIISRNDNYMYVHMQEFCAETSYQGCLLLLWSFVNGDYDYFNILLCYVKSIFSCILTIFFMVKVLLKMFLFLYL